MRALLTLLLVCSWSGAAAIPADKLHPTSGVRAQSSPTVEREPSTPDPDHTSSVAQGVAVTGLLGVPLGKSSLGSPSDLTGSSSRLRSNAGEEVRKTQASDHANVAAAPFATDPDHTIGHPRARAVARSDSPSGARPVRGSIAAPLIGGKATWYGASGMIGAAGPALRSYLGRRWRGTVISVEHGERAVVLRLTDWCACPRRLIDLSDDAFRQLAPLSTGVIEVTITRAARIPKPPATDTDR